MAGLKQVQNDKTYLNTRKIVMAGLVRHRAYEIMMDYSKLF